MIGNIEYKNSVINKKKISRIIARFQRGPLYRLILKKIMPVNLINIHISEKNECVYDIKEGDAHQPTPSIVKLILFRARMGRFETGNVQLRISDEPYNPYAGCFIFALHVKTFFRGLGIGEILLKAAVDKAKQYGASNLFLLVREDNTRAIALNKKLGFTMTINPEIEPELIREKEKCGVRRNLMRLSL